jgi:sugar (pentulose or hexulose) kinase
MPNDGHRPDPRGGAVGACGRDVAAVGLSGHNDGVYPVDAAGAGASFTGMRCGHGRAHLLRAVVDGVVFSYRTCPASRTRR